MKMVVLISLLICLMICTVAMSNAQDPDLQRAIDAYNTQDYFATINILEETISNGTYNGSLFTNLGHAYFQSGDMGRAMLNYRRALQYSPRDFELQTQIARIRANRADGANQSVLPFDLIAESTSSLRLTELALMTLVTWIIICLNGMLYLARSSWRSVLRISLIALMIPLILTVAIFGVRYWQEVERPAAVIVAETVPVHSGPGENYLTFFDVHAATEVRIIDTRREWARFILPTGQQGWVEEAAFDYVKID